MAKIENLAVETLKFAENAITGVVEVSNSGLTDLNCAVTNTAQYPVQLSAKVTGNYKSVSSGSFVQHNISLTKDSGATIIFSTFKYLSGNTVGVEIPYEFVYPGMDFTPDTSETYVLSHSTTTGGSGQLTSVASTVLAVYRKF